MPSLDPTSNHTSFTLCNRDWKLLTWAIYVRGTIQDPCRMHVGIAQLLCMLVPCQLYQVVCETVPRVLFIWIAYAKLACIYCDKISNLLKAYENNGRCWNVWLCAMIVVKLMVSVQVRLSVNMWEWHVVDQSTALSRLLFFQTWNHLPPLG